MFTLRAEQWVPKPVEEVFEFFSDAQNLTALMPPGLDLHIVRAPVVLGIGAIIEYQLTVKHIPLTWLSEIKVWEPPYRFVDVQVRGPYRSWTHEHTFKEKANGTLASDHVKYNVWGGTIVQRWLVAPELQRIFNFRRERLQVIFG